MSQLVPNFSVDGISLDANAPGIGASLWVIPNTHATVGWEDCPQCDRDYNDLRNEIDFSAPNAGFITVTMSQYAGLSAYTPNNHALTPWLQTLNNGQTVTFILPYWGSAYTVPIYMYNPVQSFFKFSGTQNAWISQSSNFTATPEPDAGVLMATGLVLVAVTQWIKRRLTRKQAV